MLTLISESAAQVNLPLVTIDPGTIVFTLINTLIIFILFKVFLFKPVGKILDKRNEMAAAEIAEAKRAKESAAKTEQEYIEKLAKAKEEAADIMKQATLRAQKREEEIVNEANQKAAEIKARAEENIERDKQRAVNDIKDEISDIVIMAASKVVEKEISTKDNEAIIADFLQNVGTAK
jgi:F-type H+-transporting ATPase subunit b